MVRVRVRGFVGVLWIVIILRAQKTTSPLCYLMPETGNEPTAFAVTSVVQDGGDVMMQ